MNIWSKHELEVKRRKAQDEARGPRRYMSPDDLFGSRRGGSADSSRGDRADNRGRRYNVLLMAIWQAKPQWSLDAIRAEAVRHLKLEDPTWRPL